MGRFQIKYLAYGWAFDIIYRYLRRSGDKAAIRSAHKRNREKTQKRGNMAEMIRILLRRSPFFRGVIRVIDIGCTLDRDLMTEKGPVVTDWEKIGGDWLKVGNDFRSAIDKFEKETANVKK
jgi:hypothetical protein